MRRAPSLLLLALAPAAWAGAAAFDASPDDASLRVLADGDGAADLAFFVAGGPSRAYVEEVAGGLALRLGDASGRGVNPGSTYSVDDAFVVVNEGSAPLRVRVLAEASRGEVEACASALEFGAGRMTDACYAGATPPRPVALAPGAGLLVGVRVHAPEDGGGAVAGRILVRAM